MFSLRDFKVKDIDEMLAIDRECFPPGISYSRGELQSYVQRKGAFGIIAEPAPASSSSVGDATLAGPREPKQPAHRIAGFAVAEMHPKGYGHVITLDIRPAYRRQGLGTILMAAAEKRVIKEGAFMMVLEAAVNNSSALAFYKQHKYNIVRTLPRYYNGELDAFFMIKRL
ncbi:MAG TPA: N-acetyltransferase [Clostridia bacterium]|nr:N-acetyltransferase [Clostridia bacterium]